MCYNFALLLSSLIIHRRLVFKVTKKHINFYGIEELNQKAPVNQIVNCHVSDEVQFKMVCANNDCAISRRFFWNNCYEQKTLELWSQFSSVLNNGIIIDIGAHSGAYSLCALAASSKNRVLSFEPFFMNYARMSTNFKINKFNTNNLFMLAAGDTAKQSVLKLNTNLHYLSSGGSLLGNGSLEIATNVVPMDSFIQDIDKPRVALVKIDVEGYEANVMDGMKNIIRSSEPIIFFECNEEPVAAYFNLKMKDRYNFYLIDDKNLSVQQTKQLQATTEYHLNNRIAIPKKNEEVVRLFDRLI